MEFTRLGRTGLRVSRLCLGTMNFGPVVDEPDAHKLLDTAQERGVNLVDTANVYGRGENKGRTEEILGSWFATGGGRRDRTVLATKVYREMGSWSPNHGGLSALNLRRACDESLRRLRTDHIDLYQFHHVDRQTPWEETWQACELLVQQGKVVYFGSSNFAGWHLAQAQAAAARRNLLGLVSEQSIYNLVRREVELEVLPAASAHGLGLLAWSPLHNGLLAGGIRAERGGVRRRQGRAANDREAARPAVEAYEDLCAELGVEPAVVALAWLLHRPGVTAPIVGPRTAEHLDGALRALEVRLDPAVLDRLDAIFPGYRSAPEQYAW